MQSGILNEIIVIERLKQKKNEFGEIETEEYTPTIRTRASVKYNSLNRVEDNAEIFFSQDVIFTVRIYNDVRNLDRIDWKGNKYRILSIEESRQFQQKTIHTELINE